MVSGDGQQIGFCVELFSEEEKQYTLTGQENQTVEEDGTVNEGYNPTTGKLLKRVIHLNNNVLH